jgi:hypothetical protein
MTLHFSLSIYDAASIEQTVAAYAELATFQVQVDAHTVSVEMTDMSPDIDDLADHFANHALHLSITTARRAVEGAQ